LALRQHARIAPRRDSPRTADPAHHSAPPTQPACGIHRQHRGASRIPLAWPVAAAARAVTPTLPLWRRR